MNKESFPASFSSLIQQPPETCFPETLPSAIPDEELIRLLPKAIVWVEEQEELILRGGVSLSASEGEDARAIPVVHAEGVRVLTVAQIQMPNDRDLKEGLLRMRLDLEQAQGLSLRYGILVRAGIEDRRRVIVHELAHTAQYERFGGIDKFLVNYLSQINVYGHPNAPLELEAHAVAGRILGGQ